MLSTKKTAFRPYLLPIAKYFAEFDPNVLTLFGSIPPVLFFVLIVCHQYLWALIALFGCLFDMVDGFVAREYNKVTLFGGFLDSTLDRLSDFFIITAFAFGHIIPWGLDLTYLCLAFLTSYIRLRSEFAKPSMHFAIGLLERPERIILTGLGLIFFMIFPHTIFSDLTVIDWIFILMVALSLLTVIQRIIYAYKML